MRGFGYSFGTAVLLYLAMQIPPVQAVIGFFGAIPLAFIALPFAALPHQWVSAGLIYAPVALALLAHVVFRRGEQAFRDSVFTLFAAGWLPYALGVIQFLCLWQHGGGTSGKMACLVLAPEF
jgi:hypothetical protein